MIGRTTLAELYVLGLLDESEAADVSVRIADPRSENDLELARAVGEAQDLLLPIDMTAPEVPVSEEAWESIERRIAAAEPLPPKDHRRTRPEVRRQSRLWKPAALVAGAASLVLAALLGWQVMLPDTPAVVAVLLDDAGEAVAVVEAFDDNTVHVTPLQMAQAAGGVFQLWTKPDPEGAPVSIGILHALETMRLAGPDLPNPREDQLYEITIEPPGGSPTGGPTGPIVGKGLARPPL